MSASRRSTNKRSSQKTGQPRTRRFLRSAWVVVLVLSLASIVLALLQSNDWLTTWTRGVKTTLSGGSSSTPTPTARPSLTPRRILATPQPRGRRVGIVAGHSGPEGDPGAVCDSGLREVDVNRAVALAVVSALRSEGYDVDLLDEFDARLHGYHADALVAIHSDSCIPTGLSGFKVARAADSAIPEAEDRLVQCLYQTYESATGLAPQLSTITEDMENYHAFREIEWQTPGAIIELGFLLADGHVLANETDRMAYGITSGVRCFLEN